MNYRRSGNPAAQNPENRNTDPTPLKSPSGMRNMQAMVMPTIEWKQIAKQAVVSGAGYTVLNYTKHKLMKSKGKDPSAIKSISTHALVQGGVQIAASGLAQIGYALLKPNLPVDSDRYMKYIPVEPLTTGLLKVTTGMIFGGVPTFWNGFTDYVLSAGTEYGGGWYMTPTK